MMAKWTALFVTCLWLMGMKISSALALTIGYTNTSPWGDDKNAIFKSFLEKRLSADDLQHIDFIALDPSVLRSYLKDGLVDGVIATDFSALDDIAAPIADIGKVQYGIACINYRDDTRFCDLSGNTKVAYLTPNIKWHEDLLEDYETPQFVAVDSFQDGIEAILLKNADGLYGTRYALRDAFVRFGLDFSRFLPTKEKQLRLWVPKAQNSAFFNRLEKALAFNPIGTEEFENAIRGRFQKPSQEVFKITLPVLSSTNDNFDQNWLRSFATQLDLMNDRVSLIVSQPFERSLRSVETGHFDMHLFVVEDEAGLKRAYPDLTYTGPAFFNVVFKVYYTDPDVYNPETKAFRPGATIATDITHANLFGPPFQGQACVECLVKMLEAGRIDAIVYAAPQIDPEISEYSPIQSQTYKEFPVRAVVRTENQEKMAPWVINGVSYLNRFKLMEKLVVASHTSFKPVISEKDCKRCRSVSTPKREEGRDFIVSMPKLPGNSLGEPQVWLKRFGKELALHNQADIRSVDNNFYRSLKVLNSGDIDLHMALIETPHFETVYPDLTYVGPAMFEVDFAIYYKDPAIFEENSQKLRSGIRVMSDEIHAPLLGSHVLANPCPRCALQMLVRDRVDAVIYVKAVLDELAQEFTYFDMQTRPYKRYKVRAVMRKEGPTRAVEAWIERGLAGMQKTGNYEKLIEDAVPFMGIAPVAPLVQMPRHQTAQIPK